MPALLQSFIRRQSRTHDPHILKRLQAKVEQTEKRAHLMISSPLPLPAMCCCPAGLEGPERTGLKSNKLSYRTGILAYYCFLTISHPDRGPTLPLYIHDAPPACRQAVQFPYRPPVLQNSLELDPVHVLVCFMCTLCHEQIILRFPMNIQHACAALS